MNNVNFLDAYDSIRLYLFEDMNKREEELLVYYPKKDEVSEENRKILV